MNISAKTDYAVRAMLVLAREQTTGQRVSAESLATEAELPHKFLEAILADLRRAELVISIRGARGGYLLGRPASQIALGEIFRAVDGPLAEVRGLRPHATAYTGVAEHLPTIWVAVRAALRDVLDEVSLEAALAGELPAHVRELAGRPGAWTAR